MRSGAPPHAAPGDGVPRGRRGVGTEPTRGVEAAGRAREQASILSGMASWRRKTLHFKFLAPWTEGRCVLASTQPSVGDGGGPRPVSTFPTYVSCNAVESFRNAVLRYGTRRKILYTTRRYSTLQGIAPEEARDRCPQLITMDAERNFSLTGGFKQAIAEAQKLESDYTQSHFGHTPKRRPP